MKRLLDVALSFVGLILLSPILIATTIAVWLQDYQSPFYVPPRVGKDERMFKMVKMRSMVVNADKSGVDSTSANDNRITAVGRFVRKYKIDELTQLWNVFKGDMSLVGPRPNVKRETDLYTSEEKQILTVRPGITDISSIVFADEGDILKDSQDPDLDYNQLIRPWKSRLCLLYIKHQSLALDIKLIWLTVLTILDRESALSGIQKILIELGADEEVKVAAARTQPLVAYPPPGATEVVMNR
jgi:lipopolysaccharide/colanic/teichoic acid biosynthesis glycosyltransferase